MMMMDMCIDFHNCDANVVDSFKEPNFFLDFTQRLHAKSQRENEGRKEEFHAANAAEQRYVMRNGKGKTKNVKV